MTASISLTFVRTAMRFSGVAPARCAPSADRSIRRSEAARRARSADAQSSPARHASIGDIVVASRRSTESRFDLSWSKSIVLLGSTYEGREAERDGSDDRRPDRDARDGQN